MKWTPGAHDICIADGYLKQRVIVFDQTRHLQTPVGVHTAILRTMRTLRYTPVLQPDSNSATPRFIASIFRGMLVYVWRSDEYRLQVFTKQGNL